MTGDSRDLTREFGDLFGTKVRKKERKTETQTKPKRNPNGNPNVTQTERQRKRKEKKRKEREKVLQTQFDHMARKINFKRIQKRAKQMKAETPRLIAVTAVNHFKHSFRVGGFTDDRFDPWKPRKRGNASDRRTRSRRAILVESGDLRRSIRARQYNFRSIVVGSYGVPYGKFHNRGIGNMPKRQFIGKSHKLNFEIRLLIFKRLKKAITK